MFDLVFLLILLVLSGFFSGSETGLTSLSRARAESLSKEGRPGAASLWKLKRNTTRMLVIILIGNNLVNIGASAMATVLATDLFGHFGPGIAVGVLTLVILVFGEVMPKSWAAHHAERVSLVAAPILLVFGKLVWPLVWALEYFSDWLHRATALESDPTVTESEVMSLVEHGAEEGTIEDEELELIERVFAFNDARVRDVMTPRGDIFSLPGSMSVKEAMPDVLGGSYSRIALYGDNPDDIVGVVHLRDLLEALVWGKPDVALKTVAREPLFVPQTQPIDELFASLRQSKRHLAMVVNEYGMLQGVVTLEDLLEELVGEIYDESDRMPEVLREVGGGAILAGGMAEMRGVAEHFGIEEPPTGKPTDTVSLWVLDHVGRIPMAGESFIIDGLMVKVTRASNRFIQQVRIERRPPVEVPPADSVAPSE